ncbi:MAG: EAL domain-containing protein [Chloroflexi bacterium]|nr:EAL domain-containing protein [Chloroflexota bacterium]
MTHLFRDWTLLASLASQEFLWITFVIVTARALRQRRRAAIDVAILFGVMAMLISASRIAIATGIPSVTRVLIQELLILALPCLMLSLVADFASVRRSTIVLAGFALVTQGIAFVVLAGALPPVLAASATAYVVVPIGWAALAFAREARRKTGVTVRRYAAIAVGTVLAAANLTEVGIMAALPGLAATSLTLLQPLLSLGVGIAYLVGFAPPLWLRRAWQDDELRSFLERAPALSGLTDGALLTALASGAREALGCDGVLIGIVEGERLRFVGTGQPYEADLRTTFGGRAILAGRALVSFDPIREIPERAELYLRTGAKMLLAAPIRMGDDVLGVLTARASHVSLFAEEDLDLCQLLADQAAVVLKNRQLIDESRESHDRLRMIVDSAHDSIIGLDRQGSITEWNDRATELFGRTRDEAIGRDAAPLFAHGISSQLASWLGDRVDGPHGPSDVFEADVHGMSGIEIPVEVALSATPGSGPTAVTMFVRDIRERRQLELEREHRADHDTLTGLPNSRLVNQHMLESNMVALVRDQPYAILLMDLDDFAEVNQTFGHAVGDQLLIQIARRLEAIVSAPQLVGRWSGDQFVVFLPRDGLATAEQIAARILASLEAPFFIETERIEIGASIGIAVYPDHADDARALAAAADVALGVAKRTTNSFAVYPLESGPRQSRRMSLRADLRRAIEGGGLELHYQPIVSMRSGDVERLEALARWDHPERGPVPPSEFIELAERTGLIRSLTEWVFGQACTDLAGWRRSHPWLRVSVNLSTRAFADAALVDRINAAAARTGAGDNALCVEITETVLMTEPERARHTISRLRECGIRVEIDDFGTGYSSLAYLQRLAVDAVKIDKQFVAAMTHDPRSDSIVRAVIRLSHELGFEVVGEGVEDRSVWDLLAANGCDTAQGFHIAKPMAGEAVAPWLDLWRTRLPSTAPTLNDPAGLLPARRDQGLVLIVDDDPAMVSVVRDVLRDHGYGVATATNGEEALASIRKMRPSLVLLDVHMPIMDGSGFAKAVRERGITVPVVVMTAGGNAQRWAKRLDVRGHLAKPFAIDQLLAVTRRFIDTPRPLSN